MGQARRDEKRDPMVVGVCEGVEVHDHISESGTGICIQLLLVTTQIPIAHQDSNGSDKKGEKIG
jgi:hypothetical protein